MVVFSRVLYYATIIVNTAGFHLSSLFTFFLRAYELVKFNQSGAGSKLVRKSDRLFGKAHISSIFPTYGNWPLSVSRFSQPSGNGCNTVTESPDLLLNSVVRGAIGMEDLPI